MLSERVERQHKMVDMVTISTILVVQKRSRLHTNFQGHPLIGTGEDEF